MRARRWVGSSALVTIGFLAPLVGAAAPAGATVTVSNSFNATGTAHGNPNTLTHVDEGFYTGVGQTGSGTYRLDSTYTPGGCVDSTYSGTATLVRSDGARLSGTFTGTSLCFPEGSHSGPAVMASYSLDLTSGTRDLVSAHFDMDCGWPVPVTVSGGSAAEGCNASGDVVFTTRIGYSMIDDHGGLHSFGGARWFYPLQLPTPTVLHMAVTPSHAGYWIVNGAGHVYALGDATAFGNASGLAPAEVVRAIAPTPTGDGYWLFTSLGRALPFGAAASFGDLHAVRLNQPIVGAAAAPDGKGYWMAASDGGVFAFGSARFFGSTGAIHLNQPVVGFAPTASGHGYWLAAADGGVFSFGDAPFRGSMGATVLNQPVTGIARYGGGYLLVAADTGVFNFGTLPFFGSDARDGLYPALGVIAVN